MAGRWRRHGGVESSRRMERRLIVRLALTGNVMAKILSQASCLAGRCDDGSLQGSMWLVGLSCEGNTE
jgi:hypothetical protein